MTPRLLIIALLLLPGCRIHYISSGELPKDRAGLLRRIASEEANIEGLEAQVVEAKVCRDQIAASMSPDDGFWAADTKGTKLSRAQHQVDWKLSLLTHAKSDLARAKSALESLEEEE